MNDGTATLRDFFEPPDPALVQAGAGGERLVAWTRLGFWLVVGLAPLFGVLAQGLDAPLEVLISAVGIAVAIAYSLAVLLSLRDGLPHPRTGFVTGTIDLTIIIGTLFIIAAAGRAEVVLHSQAAWAVILLVIMTSCLRFDTRVCLYMGVLAIAEFALLLATLVWVHEVPFTTYDLLIQAARLLLMLAAAALAMGIVNRSRSLMRASGFDPLTGLATRAYFNQRLRAELERAVRDGRPLSLVIFDLDHFKRFNDAHGHHAGDLALRHVARLIRDGLRDEDFVARWGGEEIAVIVCGLDRDAAARRAEALAERVRETPVRADDEPVSLTISAGVAELGPDGADTTSVFAAADRRVYRAKREGRDRVVASDD